MNTPGGSEVRWRTVIHCCQMSRDYPAAHLQRGRWEGEEGERRGKGGERGGEDQEDVCDEVQSVCQQLSEVNAH